VTIGPVVSSARTASTGSGSIASCSAIDDRLRLSAATKFAAQVALAALAVACGLVYPFTALPVANAVISIVLITTIVNAVNLTDVCDGLVAGLSAVALTTSCLLWPGLAWWAAPAAGACVGFLVFNAPPARIFLGDAGSHWLGFLLAALPLAAALPASTGLASTGPASTGPASTGLDSSPLLHAAQIALLLGVFLFELTLLLVARTRHGIPVWRGSPDHFSLRLQAAGLSRWATVALAWSAGALLGLCALLLPAASPLARAAAAIALSCASGLCLAALLALPVPGRTGPGAQ
jgi:UDP-GlcNAc:undecaprenyl-phosphate GlcNAc-1-phosphate transferase